jgi:hypothetical protein
MWKVQTKLKLEAQVMKISMKRCALNSEGYKLPSYIILNRKMIHEYTTSPKHSGRTYVHGGGGGGGKAEGVGDSWWNTKWKTFEKDTMELCVTH